MKIKLLFVLLASVLLYGFTHEGPVTKYPINHDKIRKFAATQFGGAKKITLINAQTSTQDFLIAVKSGRVVITTDTESSAFVPGGETGPMSEEELEELVGNLRSWTNTAMSLLKEELEKKGFTVTKDAPKELKLWVTPKIDVETIANFLFTCRLFIKAETGDGYIVEYEGNNLSLDHLHNIFGGAVGLAVEDLLNDDEILAYLGAPKSSPALHAKNGTGSAKRKIKAGNRKAWSVAEVGEFFGVPESTVRRWIVDRELRATKLGSTWLIPNSEVERISNPSKQTLSKEVRLSKETESNQPDPREWLRKLRHLKAIGLLSQEEYAEEEAKLRKAGRI